jgi:hypothetical protein
VALRNLAERDDLPVDVYFTPRYLVTTTAPPEPSPFLG